MDWYRVALTRAEYEGGEAGILQAAFEEVFFACNGPKGMALYGRWSDDRTRFHVYFTPAAASRAAVLVDAYSGTPCDAPDRARMKLMTGNEPAAGA